MGLHNTGKALLVNTRLGLEVTHNEKRCSLLQHIIKSQVRKKKRKNGKYRCKKFYCTGRRQCYETFFFFVSEIG
jgi:hypothetical protein